ncbi:MAG: hybrid sensor histidine kinase/response regulator, partial [Gammaproteobacteria bacterium]|nr:hybrid sensor histidine kinase/response regulator [Gammaproteobacteria bacterium]
MSSQDVPKGTGDRARPDRALLIAAEKVRIQYRNMPTAFVGSAVICSLMGFALAQGAGLAKVICWVAVVYTWVVARMIQWRAFNRINPAPADMRLWRRLSIGGSAAAGLIWGVGAIVLYVPNDLAYQFFLVIGLVGMGAGCVYASASVMPSFFAYFYPSILLPAVLFLRAHDSVHFITGVMMLVYLSLMTPFALRVYRLIDESIKLRFENLGLIGELREQKDAAEDANIAKSRFLAAASHDLRQPLHALGLFVQALQETPLATRERHVIGNIRRSVDAMEELFNALLDISRLDAGVVQPHITTIPLAAAFDRVRFEYAQIARQKRVSLRVVKTSLFVQSDPSLLARLIRNLLSNAVRYTDAGGVVLGCRRMGSEVRIEVWDTGKGIPANRHDEIFQEFYQLGNPERDRRKGLGLGLAIVKRLAKLLNYRVSLRSVIGKGSVFSITLPRGCRDDYVPAETSPESAAFDLSHALVLVIDDEAAVQEGMAALLRRWKCDVLTAGSSAEMMGKLVAVQRLPDLIVSDYRLRDNENGIQVVEALRSEFNVDIPALLVTGDTGPDRLRDA